MDETSFVQVFVGFHTFLHKVATTLAGNNVAIDQNDAGSCDKKSEEIFHLVCHGNVIYGGSWSINN